MLETLPAQFSTSRKLDVGGFLVWQKNERERGARSCLRRSYRSYFQFPSQHINLPLFCIIILSRVRKKLPGEEKPTPRFLIPEERRENRSISHMSPFLCRSVCRGKQTWPPDFSSFIPPCPGKILNAMFTLRRFFLCISMGTRMLRSVVWDSLQKLPEIVSHTFLIFVITFHWSIPV